MNVPSLRISYIDTLHVFIQTLAIYLFLMAALRFAGRRQLGQLTVVDLVIVIVLGSAVETAMIRANTSLPAGLICAGTLLAANRSFGLLLARHKWIDRLVCGSPILLVKDGHFIEEHLKRAGLTETDVMEAIRERDVANIEQVRLAVMEVDGTINVIRSSRNALKANVKVHAAHSAGRASQ